MAEATEWSTISQKERGAQRSKDAGKWSNFAGNALSWIPFVGPFLQIAGMGAKAGLDIDAGKKMQRAALLKEQQAKQLQARAIAPEYIQAQKAAQFAAQGGLGYEQYMQSVNQNQAQALNAARNSATGGDAALVAASNILGQTNAETNRLATQDALQRVSLGQEARQGLKTIADQKTARQVEQLAEQNKIRAAAAALSNAGTANIMSGIGTATDAVRQVGRTIFNTESDAKAAKQSKAEGSETESTSYVNNDFSDNPLGHLNTPQDVNKPVDTEALYALDPAAMNNDDMVKVANEKQRLEKLDPTQYRDQIQALRDKINKYTSLRANPNI